MFLFRKKAIVKSIPNPLGGANLPKQLPEEEQLKLVQRLRAKNASQQDKERLCKSHLRLAINIAGSYSAQFPSMTDDLVSVGCMAIWKATLEAPDKLHDDNFTAYCVGRIHSDIYRFACQNHLVRVPQSTVSTRKEKGLETEKIKVHQGLPDEMPSKRKAHAHRRVMSVDPRKCKVEEIRELISKSTRNDTEREIVRLREAGYRDRQIGEMIGLSTTRVQEIRALVGQRFDQLNA